MSDNRALEERHVADCSQEGSPCRSNNAEGELEQGQGLGPASGLPTGMGSLPSPATLPRRPSSETGHAHQQQVELQVQEQRQEQEDQAPLLLDAARKGDVNVVMQLLEAGVSDQDGRTALWTAAQEGRTEVVRALLDAGTHPDAANEAGRTALWAAAQEGHTEVVRALVEAAAQPDAANEAGITPLLIAIARGQEKMLLLLLEAGVNLEVATEGGLRPLGLATMLGYADIANALVACGASASGLPLEREEVQHQVEDMKNIMSILGLQPKMELSEDAYLPAELLAFHCRAVMVDNANELGEDYIGRMVDWLVRSIPAVWQAAYCSAFNINDLNDSLAMGSQIAALLQDLVGRQELADVIRLLRNLEVVPSCPVLEIGQWDTKTITMAFNPSGRLLAAAGTNTQEVDLWDLQLGVHRTLHGSGGLVRCLSFSNDSKWLATGYTAGHMSYVCVYDMNSGKHVNSFTSGFSYGTVKAVAFSCDGNRLAYLTDDGHIYIYDTESWVQTWKAPCDFKGIVTFASFQAKGDAMYLAIITGKHSNEVSVYTIHKQDQRAGSSEATARAAVVLTHDSHVKHVAVSADWRLIATIEGTPCGNNEQLQLWDMATGYKLGDPVDMGDDVSCMAISPNGCHLAIGRKYKAVQVYKCSEGSIGTLAASLDRLPGCISLVFSADGKRLAATESNRSKKCKVHVWDVAFSNISWPAAGSLGPTADITRAAITIPNTLMVRSYFRRPLFYGTEDGSIIPIVYTPGSNDSSCVGAFTSSWLRDGGQLLDVAARGDNFSRMLLDLLQSPAAARTADTVRAVASSLAPHIWAAASMALLHLGPSGAIMALLGVAWIKLLEAALLAWVIIAERWGEVGYEEASERSKKLNTSAQVGLVTGKSLKTKHSNQGLFHGSCSCISISEVALKHAALFLKGCILEPLLANPWVPTFLWTKPAIKALLLLHWSRFTKHIVFYEFLIRAVYTGLFVAYALTMAGGSSWQDDNSSGAGGDGGRQDRCVASGVGSGQQGMMYVLAIMTAEYVVMEARQMWGSGWRWLHHTNLVDLAGLALMSTILGLHWSCGASLQTLRGLSAVLVLVLFFRLLIFAAANDEFGKFVRMVVEVTSYLRHLFIVLGVVYGGVALALLVIGTDMQEKSDASTNGSAANATSSYNGTVSSLARPVSMRLYAMIYGDFSMDWVMGSNAPSFSLGNLAAIICSIYMFLVTIILLNLMIVIIGEVYKLVMDLAVQLTLREKAWLIAETEQLLPAWFRSRRDDKLFRCERVLVLQPAASEQSDGSDPDPSESSQQLKQAWQGRMGIIQSLVEGLQTKVVRRMDAGQDRLEAQLQAQQGRLEAQLQAQQGRLEAQLQAQQGRLEVQQGRLEAQQGRLEAQLQEIMQALQLRPRPIDGL